MSGFIGTTGQRDVDVSQNNGLITLTPTEPAITERIRQAVDQSIEIIQRRVNELGLVEPTIQREGVDRILVQVPGLQDPTRLKEILGKTAKLDFRMVDLSMTPEQAAATHPPEDSEILDGQTPGEKYLIEKRVLVSGGDLVDAQPGFDQQTSQPIVNFRFNSSGARKFAEATQANVGKPFAIVLDNKVISAPVIREPILGGSGPDFGEFYRSVRQRPRHPAARRRAAGAADDHRGAHGRSGVWARIRSMPASMPPTPARRWSSSSCS